MSSTCEIEFENNPRKIVYAGDFIRGKVRLNLTENTNVRCVYIRINGKAKASWQQGRTRITSKEKYFDERVNIVEETTGNLLYNVVKAIYLN